MNASFDKEALEHVIQALHGIILALDKDQNIVDTLPKNQSVKFKDKNLRDIQELAHSALFEIKGMNNQKALQALFPEAQSIVTLNPAETKLLAMKKAYMRAKKVLKRERRKFQEALYGLERRNKQSIREMNLAVEMQKSMLPRSYPVTPYFSCTHRYIPMAMVGGDYFDIFQIDEHRFGIMISDVSGHGIAPAFITAMIKSTFDYLKNKSPSPTQAIRSLNEEFSKVITTNHYVTVFYGILDFNQFSIRYCNAGHPGQLIAHVDGSFSEMKTQGNPIIGLMDDYDFKEGVEEFHPGDIFCFFTDGIIESRGIHDAMFGTEGIKRVISETSSFSLDTIADTILTELIQFMENPIFEDDITLFLLGTDSDVH